MRKVVLLLIPTLSFVFTACDQPMPEPKVDQPQDLPKEEKHIGLGNPDIPNRPISEQVDTDRFLVQRIRQSLSNDNTLSLAAKNIQIISQNGNVRLEGVVASDRERALITTKVRQTKGVVSIVNEIKVTGNERY